MIGAALRVWTAAYYLQLRGHDCDVFEAEPERQDVLRYGSRSTGWPKGSMDRELRPRLELGTTLKPNMRLGRDFHLGDLVPDYGPRSTSTSAATSLTDSASSKKADGMVRRWRTCQD